jgi:hypothetical protein
MGIRVSYDVYSFQEPDIISPEVYSLLKINPHNNYFDNFKPEPFYKAFKSRLSWLAIGVAGYLLGAVLDFLFKEHVKLLTDWFMLIFGVMVIGSILSIIPEYGNYTSYIQTHNDYFSKMQFAINQSKDYSDFCYTFYLSSKKELNKSNRNVNQQK